MTPQEHDLISDLFERMRRQGLAEIDADAADLIERAMRDNPDAAYQLVQTVIVQNMALERAEARIRELEDEVRSARTAGERSRSSGSFLGGLFGDGDRDDDRGGSRGYSRDRDDDDDDDRRRSYGRDRRDYDEDDDDRRRRTFSGTAGRASVPSAGFGSSTGQQTGAPWSAAGRAQQPQPARGGSFLGTAMTTAAGVAGGMLLADGLRGMFGGDSGVAGATEAAKSSTGASEPAAPEPIEAANTDEGGGGGFFDSLFGGGDSGGEDDSFEI